MLWFIVTILSVLFAYWGDEYGTTFVNKKTKIVFRILLVVTLSYVTGLGGSISTDHESYLWHYTDYSLNGLSSVIQSFRFQLFSAREEGFEPIFALINVLCSKIGLSAVGFCGVVALITNAFFVSVIFRFRFPYIAVILFLASVDYFQEVNLVRQMLAVSLCFYALHFLVMRKWLKYILLVIAASFIHTSASVMLSLFLFAPLLKENKKSILLAILAFIWLFSIASAFGLIPINISYLSAISYYEQYINGMHEGAVFDIITNLVVILFFFFSFTERKSEDITLYTVIFILGCVLRNFAVQYYWFYRLSFYFTFIYCCFVPEFFSRHGQIFSKGSKKQISLPFVLITVYYCLIIIRSYILVEPSNKLGTVMYSLSELF